MPRYELGHAEAIYRIMPVTIREKNKSVESSCGQCQSEARIKRVTIRLQGVE